MLWKNRVRAVTIVTSTILALAGVSQAQAEGCTQSNTGGATLATTVASVKGSMSCADIAGRSVVAGTVTMNPDGSINWDSNGQRVTEALVTGTNGGNTCEYVYPDKATKGANLGYLKSNNTYQGVQGVQLCTDGATPVVSEIPDCSTLNLDGLTITCPTSGAKSIIYNFETSKPFYNQSGTAMACVCNNGGQPLTECDPNIPAGQPGACVAEGYTQKTGAEVTTHIEINNDPYVCETIGGTRKCYCYNDADPTRWGCQ